MTNETLEMILNLLPSIIATITCILCSFKLLNGLNQWKESNENSSISQLIKDLKNVVKQNLELKNKMDAVLSENKELKDQLNKAIKNLIEEAQTKEEEE